MSLERTADLRLEIAHVLFMDVVGFSKLLINDESEILEQLNQLVRDTPHFREAEAAGKLIRLATGDGMALVFFNSPEAPVECALEISKALQNYPQIQLRMGVHSGPVSAVSDVNDRSNVTGAGINMAQRVMDCGDAGHILLSRHVAEDLEQYRQWQPCLHDLGECEVKHGVRVHAVNFYTDEVGNPEVPQKFKPVAAAVSAAPAKPVIPKWTAIAAILILIAIATFLFWQRGKPKTSSPLSVIPEKSIAVLPFVDLSQNKDQEYFSDGIAEELLNRLAQLPDLKVAARTSAFQFRGKNLDMADIGQQLKVGHVLEGSVRK